MPPELTIACEDRDFTAWRGGAEHVLVWAIDVDVPAVRSLVAAARHRWKEVLLPRYERQPHITVGYGGPIPAPGPPPQDEPYSPERVDEARAAVASLRLAPFEVQIGGWASFPMGPYLAAEAPELHELGRALGEDRWRAYVPHVTIGHYAVARPLAEIAERARDWDHGAVSVPVRAVSLMRYDAADIAGPLTVVEQIPLTGS